MLNLSLASVITFYLSVFVHNAHSLVYRHLEVLGINCPDLKTFYTCQGYRHKLSSEERGCECDSSCNAFNDCCISAPSKWIRVGTSDKNRMTCQPIGERTDGGVYVISTCSNNWQGPLQIHQKCEGPVDFSDPLYAAPVTSISQAITYRNLHCATCNNADMTNLKMFQLLLSCPGLSPSLMGDQVYADLGYNQQLKLWGVDRLNSFGNSSEFFSCDIAFEVPSYFNNSVRFCHPTMISTCPSNYKVPYIRKACEDYMATVYDDQQLYRNPHCAICNGKNPEDIHCKVEIIGRRKRPMSFALLLDVNQSDGDQVGMKEVVTPQCSSGQRYDPFFKICRTLECAIPGDVLVNNICVPQ